MLANVAAHPSNGQDRLEEGRGTPDDLVSSFLFSNQARQGGDVVPLQHPRRYPPSSLSSFFLKSPQNIHYSPGSEQGAPVGRARTKFSNKSLRGHDHWKSVMDNILIEFLASLFIIISAVMYNGLREDGTCDACKPWCIA